MLLLSAATAFRGDSAQRLLWSDMFISSVPMDDLGLGTVVPAFSVLADGAKDN
ncbi:hypothetical protein PILCRDRAFT_9638 [Piloderma croceum F 1598]|uniref:Uncharacterized protein n=1 Tax=Piloderma croceum (strain F 1598) TaxID=765440 RepID=A0A0C3FLQ1_PILCF|nr:hypothetical protein PILCRDRAFT_9638 [Piloderma croceum F 1598]